jgi:hypothetical protein
MSLDLQVAEMYKKIDTLEDRAEKQEKIADMICIRLERIETEHNLERDEKIKNAVTIAEMNKDIKWLVQANKDHLEWHSRQSPLKISATAVVIAICMLIMTVIQYVNTSINKSIMDKINSSKTEQIQSRSDV